jgi:MFS transporter, OFA family, oxalate/formate antiporter
MTSVATPVSAFGVFLPVLASAFGWTRGAISTALSINLVLGGFAAFAIAHVADRRGPREVLAVTVLIGGTGLALMSRVGALWQMYLFYGVMVGVGFSSVYVLTTATVSRWFEARRGLALAVVLSGFNLGWLVGGPFAAFLIDRWGWRTAYVVLGLLVVGVGVPACLGARFPDRPASRDGGAGGSHVGASFRGALRDRRLWLIGGGWSLTGVVYMMVPVHAVPFARDHGLPLEQASFLLTAYGVGSALGRVAAGLLADRFGTPATLYGCLSMQAIALAVILASPSPWTLSAALVAFGVGAAGADNALVKVIPEVFGVVALASVMSVIGLGWRAGAALGPAAAGFVYDLTRSYAIPFAAGLALLAVAALLFHLATRRS